jgi:site-specific DNA-methyltransferase (adenine-specific)
LGSNKNDIILDNCIGSGTTGVAAINTQRQFIGIEYKQEYFKIANERVKKAALINET